MKSKIILFLTLITYILSAITISTVEKGTCADNKYTFVIKANSDANITTAWSAIVTLASPENTTPTCTYPAVTDLTSRRRLSSGDFNITCTISSKLDNVEIKVSLVTIGSVKATVANSGNYPVSMSGNVTCGTTTNTINTDPTTPNGDKFIQISAFLFMLMLTVF